MSLVTVSSVQVHDNPAPFTSPLKFEICYEALSALQEDLEWRLTYVGSALDEKCDQVLESVDVGPIAEGVFRFLLEADPPQADKIPKEDLLGATVIFLSGFYREQEFVRVGYYVNNEYPAGEQEPRVEGDGSAEAELLAVALPETIDPTQITRNICDEPRVTKFPITWDNSVSEMPPLEAEELALEAEMATEVTMESHDPSIECSILSHVPQARPLQSAT